MDTTIFMGIFLLIVSLAIIFTKKQRAESAKTANIFGFLLLLLAVPLIISSFIRIVPAGTVGVVDLFGRVSEKEKYPGLNIINPFAKLIIFNIKTEEIKETMVVPSQEGLSVKLDISILYRMLPEKASEIYKKVGVDYRNIIIIPQFRSVCRGVTVNYEAKALYTSGREEIAQKIFTELENLLKARGIILENVLLRAISLPQTVSQAIEQKLKAEQEAEQMKFILEKERKEAERKIIEAEGIAKAQEIIAQKLSEKYLTWRFLEKIESFGKGPNNAIILLPYDQKIIPLLQVPGKEEKK